MNDPEHEPRAKVAFTIDGGQQAVDRFLAGGGFEHGALVMMVAGRPVVPRPPDSRGTCKPCRGSGIAGGPNARWMRACAHCGGSGDRPGGFSADDAERLSDAQSAYEQARAQWEQARQAAVQAAREPLALALREFFCRTAPHLRAICVPVRFPPDVPRTAAEAHLDLRALTVELDAAHPVEPEVADELAEQAAAMLRVYPGEVYCHLAGLGVIDLELRLSPEGISARRRERG